MKSKRKVQKAAAGAMLAAGAIQGGLGAYQAIEGVRQQREAERALRELRRNRPDLAVPTAIRRLADEPIAEEFMEMQEMGAQRRTSQAIDTLGKAGGRGLGMVARVAENERIGEQQRAGQYEQTRQQALSQLGAAEERLNRMEFQQYLNDINAARMSMEAGQQNVMSGIGGVGQGAVFAGMNMPEGSTFTMDETMTFGDIQANQPVQVTPKGFNPNFNKGGVMKTRGKFSHKDNPKYLIDGNSGELEAELTGNETVFNDKQSAKMERLANQGKEKELAKFVKGTFKKFRAKRNK